MLRCCAKTYLTVMIGCLLFVKTEAQDPQFTQFYSSRIYINPAFTGNTEYGRFSSQARIQWPALHGYTTYGAYYDQNVMQINSGFGASILQDFSAQNALRFTKASFQYAYGFTVRRNLYARTGIGFSYNSLNVDLSRFTFNDQFITGSGITVDAFRFNRLRYADLAAGLLLYNERFWVGAGIFNMRNLGHKLDGAQNPFNTKLSLHGAYLIPVNKDIAGNFFKDLTVMGHFKTQWLYHQLDLAAYYGYSNFLIGVGYRSTYFKNNGTTQPNRDALMFVSGVRLEQFRISYSYDISVSRLYTYSMGAHEIGLQYLIPSKNPQSRKKGSRRNIPCPDFGPSWQD